jgi:hypothetical protein
MRFLVSHKNITGVKKISKEKDDSVPIAARPRGAPTLAAVPVRRAVDAGPAVIPNQHTHISTPRAPYIQIYPKSQNTLFK